MTGKIVISTTGTLTNNEPGFKPNPKECDDFYATIDYNIIGEILEIKEWYILGELPKGLKLNTENEIYIDGNIKPFVLQELNSNYYYPKEDLKIDGSNRLNNGNLISDSYVFNFSINVDYTIIDEASPSDEANPSDVANPPIILDMTATSNLNITLIKSGNINNTLFMKNYLDVETPIDFNTLEFYNGKLTMVVKTDKRNIPYNGKKYYKKDLEDLYLNHPGPFAKCKE